MRVYLERQEENMSRDSWVLWLGTAVAVLGYLMTAEEPPTAWGYMEWLQAISFILVWISGKLATSPLKGGR